MANNPFDLMTLNVRERPLSSDHNVSNSQFARTVRDQLRRRFAGGPGNGPGTGPLNTGAFSPKSGFVGEGFMAAPISPVPGALSLQLLSGYAFQDAPADVPATLGSPVISGLSDLSPYKPLVLNAAATIVLGAPPAAGRVRIDLIEVAYDRYLTDQQQRGILDPTLQAFIGTNVFKTLSFSLDGLIGSTSGAGIPTSPINYKVNSVDVAVGAFDENTAGPAVDPGYMAVAEVIIFDTTTPATFTKENIRDKRQLLFDGATGRIRVSIQQQQGGHVADAVQVIECSPGIDLAVTSILSGGSQAFAAASLWAMLGAQPSFFAGRADVWWNGTIRLSKQFLPSVDLFTEKLTAADQGTINNTNVLAASFSPYKPAIGQPALICSLGAVESSGTGGTGVAMLYEAPVDDSPLRYDVDLVFAY